MLQTSPLPLHLASSISELNALADFETSVVNPKVLGNSAKKILNKAETYWEKGDEEQSYVLYMKYLHLLEVMQNVAEYKKQKKFYDKLIGVANATRAITMAEALQESLHKRYELKQEEKEAKQMLEAREEEEEERKKKEKKERNSKNEDMLKPEKVGTVVNVVAEKEIQGDTISSTKLYSLMQKQSTSFLLMDVRSSKDFKLSHIKHGACISVPEENIKLGITAMALGKSLPADSKDLWPKRGTVDHIIVLDWDSNSFSEESTVKVLKDILMKWDPGNVYRSDLLLLHGGYEDWLMTFPMMTTNPMVSKPVKNNAVDTDTIMNFDYPELDDVIITSVPSAPPASSRSEVHSSNDGPVPTRLTFVVDTWPKTYPSDSRPVVDRSVKPKESTEKKNIPPKSEVQSFVEARTVLPSRDFVNSVISNNKESDHHPQPSNDEEGRQDSHTENNEGIKPSIDRTLKAKALLKYEERSKEISDILKTKEEIVDGALRISKKIFEIENQLEVTRQKKEMEAIEELRGEQQKREEELLKYLEMMEEEKQKQDQDIELVQNKLDELTRKKEEEERRMATPEGQEKGSIGQTKDRIKRKDKERTDVDKQVEELRRQREEKLRREAERKLQERELKKEEEARLAQEEQERLKEQERRKEQERKKEQEELERQKKEEIRLQEEKKNKQTEKEKSDKGSYLTKLKDDRGSPVSSSSANLSMRRSLSSPNISKMVDKEDASVKSHVPQFDRATKPQCSPSPQDSYATREMKLSAVYGSTFPGRTGLKNLGNTCYMNSILQCISSIRVLVEFFINGLNRNNLNRHSRTGGKCAEELSFLLKSLWSGQYRSVGCHDLKNTVGAYYLPFSGHGQQDSHEFLTYLLDLLHEDLNMATGNPVREQHDESIEDSVAANQAWNDFLNSNKSIISHLFYGQRKSTVTCLTCSKKSAKFEPFFNLSIPIPPRVSRCSLEDCFKLYLKDEHISGWKCPKCKTERNASKKIDLWKLPSILILHLQRFCTDSSLSKSQAVVDFPLDNLQMAAYTPTGSPQKPAEHTTFHLNAISNHYGTMEAGHYTAACKHSTQNSYGWYMFDDLKVNRMDANHLKTHEAYILFYCSVRL